MIFNKKDIAIDYAKADCSHDATQPYLECYIHGESGELPLKQKRSAVIICPGGGFNFCSDRESEPVALAFLNRGVQAFVLRYSVAPNHYPGQLLELAEAIRYVRANAEEFQVDENKIYVCGFSAGGHLAASLGIKWNDDIFRSYFQDSSENPSWKPSGMILGYSVLSLGEYTHEGSKKNILGDRVEWQEAFSLEQAVNKDTVPVFIWHTFEDTTVPLENTLQLISALRKNNISFESHIYERGCHGLSMCNEQSAARENQLEPDNENWFEMAMKWMKRRS